MSMYSYYELPCSRYRRPGPQSLLKGIVTKVNLELLYFELDHAFRIYIDISNSPVLLPNLDDSVEVMNLKTFKNSTYTGVMGPETTFKYPSSQDMSSAPCTQFLISNEVYRDLNDIMAGDLLVRKLESFVQDSLVYVALKVLWHNLKMNNQSLKKLETKVVKDVLYANENSSLYTFHDFKELSCFNVYPSKDQLSNGLSYDYLFGILYVSNTGRFVLKDCSREIFVKFISPFNDLHQFHQAFVLIKSYTVFTETYKDLSVPTLQYILISQANVIVIKDELEDATPTFCGINELYCGPKMAIEYYLHPRKVSEAIYGYSRSPECWLEATVADSATFNSSERVYVVLPQELLWISAFLKEDVIYRVFTNTRWKMGDLTKHRELYGLKELKKLIVVNKDSVFQETDLSPVNATIEVLQDFNEVKSSISKTRDYSMISFTLQISRKSFQQSSYPSWFSKRFQNLPYFGNIGNFQQQLTFFDEEARSYIDLYLANRDNHVWPLGLICGMMVKVKHVQVIKRKYLRSTVFTSFELVGFMPELNFSSATLLFSHRDAWKWRTATPPTILSAFPRIPLHCTVHGSVIFRSILDLHLDTVCVKCGRNMQYQCSTCDSSMAQVIAYMVIQVQDSCHSEFTMEINDVSFLLALLGINNEKGIDLLTKECLRLKSVKIDFTDLKSTRGLEDDSPLHKMINVIQMDINLKLFFLMEVLCIRQEYGRKVWRVLDYRLLADVMNLFRQDFVECFH